MKAHFTAYRQASLYFLLCAYVLLKIYKNNQKKLYHNFGFHENDSPKVKETIEVNTRNEECLFPENFLQFRYLMN